ncbi:MAG: hypothetical protein DCC58_16545, partial [Chloroflexi bacterium]
GQPTWVEAQAFTQNPLYYATANYSIANPADSANPGMLAVGAAAWSMTSAIEDYSSQGPTTDGRVKPDIAGVARGDSVSYGPNGFAGTSQAAPHVAGLAALVKQRFPHFTPAQVAEYLKSNAQPRGNGRPNNTWGWGLAYLPQITTTQPTATATHVSSNPFDDVWRTTDAAVAGGMRRWRAAARATPGSGGRASTSRATSSTLKAPAASVRCATMTRAAWRSTIPTATATPFGTSPTACSPSSSSPVR